MTALDRDEEHLVAALHDPGSTPGDPDLDRLARVALHGGGRLHRRRRAATAAAMIAAAGLVTVVVLGQGGSGAGRSLAPIAADGGSTSLTAKASADARAVHRARMLAQKHQRALARAAHAAASLTASLSTAYAVLDAPGWSAPQGPMDDKLYYVNGQQSLSLNWRPAADFSPKYDQGTVVATTTMDGVPAQVYADRTVVGPVTDGRFLTLSGSPDLTVDELVTLATEVHRQ